MADDELLTEWLRDRSPTAFAALVQRYSGLVFAVALRAGLDRETAQDAVQNVFALLVKKAASLRSPDRLASWLHGTARHEANRLRRRDQTRLRIMSRYAADTAAAARQDDASLWKEALPHLDDAVASLPETDRKMVLLRFFQAQSYRETASAVGTTEEACRKRTVRALERLSAFLRRREVSASAVFLGTGLAEKTQVAAATLPSHNAIATAALSKSASLFWWATAANSLRTAAWTVPRLTGAAAFCFLIPAGIQVIRPAAVQAASRASATSLPEPAQQQKLAAVTSANKDDDIFDLEKFKSDLRYSSGNLDNVRRLLKWQRRLSLLRRDQLPPVAEFLIKSTLARIDYLDPGTILTATVYARWAELSGTEVLAEIAAHESPQARLAPAMAGAMPVLMQSLGLKAALSAAMSIGTSHTATRDEAIAAVARRAPAEALAVVPGAVLRERILKDWAFRDWQAATRWIAECPGVSDEEKTDWRGRALPKSVPRVLEALEVLPNMVDTKAGADIAEWCVSTIGSHAPQQTASAWRQLPEQLKNPRLLRTALGWAVHDGPGTAIALLATVTPDAQLAALREMSVQPHDAAVLLQSAASLPPSPARDDWMRAAVKTWRTTSEAQAARWLQSATCLPAELKQSLLNP